jgi:tRNA (guanine37-N1)-methyltransferase
MTLFPEMVLEGLNTSITGRAVKNGHITIDAVNIRDFAGNKHGHVDDYPYGGGAGMVMQPGPVYDTYQHVVAGIEQRKCEQGIDTENASPKKPRVIYMTPQGTVFNQSIAEELSKEEDLILLCGHYEGIDERVLDMIVTDHISIGDYVLTGGELPAMVVIDAISRLVPGVLNNDVSAEFETFHENLLEYPQYTRPEEFMGEKVPEVLLSGHHKNIESWRREQSVQRTKERRPDLWEKTVNQTKD